jgi:AraC family transcriptional regulator
MKTPLLPPAAERKSQICLLDSGDRSNLLRISLISDPPGVVEIPAAMQPRVIVCFGRPVQLVCTHGDRSRSGLAIHGDIHIVPSGLPTRWESKEGVSGLVLRVASELLMRLAADSNPDLVRLCDRNGIRDPQIEHMGWALLTEAEKGFPSGNLYLESMATSLAIQLLANHSLVPGRQTISAGALPVHKLKLVRAYIEDNLSQKLSLRSIAEVAGLSVTNLKMLFRRSVGMPVHQYVIRRRVERAAQLLREGRLPGSQIALESGFSHQSHMALHMQRILGASPSQLAKRASHVHGNGDELEALPH